MNDLHQWVRQRSVDDPKPVTAHGLWRDYCEECGDDAVNDWLLANRDSIGPGLVADVLRVLRQRKAKLESKHSIFDDRYVVDEENTWKRMGDMVGSDHGYVADGYDLRAIANVKHRELHRILQRKVGDRRTSEVFTEEQLQSMVDYYLGGNNGTV